MNRAFFLILILFCFIRIAQGQENENQTPVLPMKVEFVETSAHVGDLVHLRLGFTLPTGAKLSDAPFISGIEKGKILHIEKTPDGLVLELLADSLDTFSIAELELAYTDGHGNPARFRSDPVSLKIAADLPDNPEKASPRPIKDIVPQAPLWSRYLPVILGIMIVLCLCTAGVWYVMKKKRLRDTGFSTAPPEEIARKALEKLREQMAGHSMEEKDYYFALSEILRAYMAGIRPFPAMDMTTEEISSQVEKEEDRRILPVLKEADWAKFADGRFAEAKKEEHWNQAWEYVEKTAGPKMEMEAKP